jgi:hypothetical protein
MVDLDWAGDNATLKKVKDIAKPLGVTIVEGGGYPMMNLIVRGAWADIRIWLYKSGYMDGLGLEQQMEIISWIEPAS